MKNMVTFQIFECVAVIFETFIVHQYINGIFERHNEQKNTTLWYVLFCFGLSLMSLFLYQEIILVTYTLIGMFILSSLSSKNSIPSSIFSILYFSAIMIAAEIFASLLISGLWGVNIASALEYGMPRVLCILVAKLIQILLVKLSVVVVNWKADSALKGIHKLMLPLLFCQIFSIIWAYYIYKICYTVHGDFEPIALFAMAGIVYMNIVVFWYFDRVKAVFELQSINEAAQLKLELQKQYHEMISKHQQETDKLWHDMKKHINLMKTLINSGQHKISTEYIQELEAQMGDTIKIIRTDYPVLSALLTEQMQRAKGRNIIFNIEVKIESDINITPVDLCIVLGNLYDNAFAACLLLSSNSKKEITTSITQHNNIFAVFMQNTYSSIAIPFPRSGKHGLGLKNVKQVVLKYNGRMEIIEENGIYSVTIVIP